MSEILFRGKSIYTHKWVYGYFVAQDKETYIFEQPEVDKGISYGGCLDCCEMTEVVPETVGRLVNDPCYTDYTDRRYFQGDIIKLYAKFGRPTTRDGSLGIVVDEHCYTCDGMGRHFSQDTLQAVVVGNVYDNPELVGKKYADLYKYYHAFRSSVTRDDLKRNMEVEK